MTTASEQTRSSATDAGAAEPTAGRAPVAAPAAGYVGSVLALIMLGLGVVALRDSAVSAGWLDGQEWTKSAIGWIDGLTFDWWMVPVGIAAIPIGAWWVYAALRPRRRTAVAVNARRIVWIAPADLARLASRAAENVPGVLEARASATLRKITIIAHTTADSGDIQTKSAVGDAVRAGVLTLMSSPPKIRVRTRTGSA